VVNALQSGVMVRPAILRHTSTRDAGRPQAPATQQLRAQKKERKSRRLSLSEMRAAATIGAGGAIAGIDIAVGRGVARGAHAGHPTSIAAGLSRQ
jgi:hypothetical protein